MTGFAKRLVLMSLLLAAIAVGCTSDGTDVSGPTTSAPTTATGPTTTTGPTSTGGVTTAPTTTGEGTTGPTSGIETSGPSGLTLRTPSPNDGTSGPTTGPQSPLPGGPPASTTMSGTWTGEWVDGETGVAASLTFSLEQHGSDLSGSVTLDGTPCLTGGVVSGEAHRNAVRLTVPSREVEIIYDGTLSGPTMSGDYTSTCDAPHGTWRVTKQK